MTGLWRTLWTDSSSAETAAEGSFRISRRHRLGSVRRTVLGAVLSISPILLSALDDSRAVSADEPRVRIGLRNADAARADFQAMVKASPDPKLQKEWPSIDEILMDFLTGIDPTRPIGVEVIFSDKETVMLQQHPVLAGQFRGKGQTFEKNLDTLGYVLKQAKGFNGWELKKNKNAPTADYYCVENQGYATISPRQSDLLGKLPAPAASLPASLTAPVDLVAELKNTAEGITARHQQFQAGRQQVEAAVKFKRGQDEHEFELGRFWTQMGFDELERFVCDSAELSMTWTTDESTLHGTGQLVLEPLPGTELDASLQEFAVTPSRFAGIPKPATPIVYSRVNAPLDVMRLKHVEAFYPKLRPVLKGRIDQRTAATADNKTASKAAVDVLIDLIQSSALKLKRVDAFLDMTEVDAKQGKLVCGICCTEGGRVVEILKQLPGIREDWKVEFDVAEVGAVKIHRILVPPRRQDEFKSLFGVAEPAVLVGVSDDVIWGSIGPTALDDLKTAIDQAATPATAPDVVVLDLVARFGPLLDLMETVRIKEPLQAKTKAEQQQVKRQQRLRKLAIDCFAPKDDVLTGQLRRDGGKIVGQMGIGPGINRFLGSLIADFASENLR